MTGVNSAAGFPQRLRALRKRKRVSGRGMADFCQLSKSAVARYERGEQEPTASAICRMADYLGVSTDELLGFKENFWSVPDAGRGG